MVNVFSRRKIKKEPSTESSYLPSPPSSQDSKSSLSTRSRVVSEEKEFAPPGSLPALKDNRLFRVPQGRPSPLANRSCPRCSGPCTRLITRSSNRNGNAGRPYIKCMDAKCDKFICWDDEVGTYELNPRCGCDKPSRQAMSNADKGRQIYYECVAGKCDFWRAHVDEYGIPVSFNGDLAEEMDRLNFNR